ncbi:mitochondrial cardiolipin hydrolase-like [Branchiostoma floridae]|uniref:Mitochondrial cardiolipin hydrolase n=1 Tax=Branchiostoma floridae TaxID=7739 RepID=A0A9J7N9T9_BRAFL|nr:mitochondrial cardiolipin hydrolase-like [Branchiostoma floridae]
MGYMKLFGIALAASFAVDLLYLFVFRRRKRVTSGEKAQKGHVIHKVLFFPDAQVSCPRQSQPGGCKMRRCKFTHDTTSLSQLKQYLCSAKKTLDLCVYTISCLDLARTVVDLHHKGVIVRVLTDKEQMEQTGSQVWYFRSEGIQVRHDNTPYFMHHKFAIVDNSLLINGSFNWTRQAITGNSENLLVTNSRRIVRPYIGEFQRLWDTYEPGLLKKRREESEKFLKDLKASETSNGV